MMRRGGPPHEGAAGVCGGPLWGGRQLGERDGEEDGGQMAPWGLLLTTDDTMRAVADHPVSGH